jgi:hypothetical protein
MASPSQTRTSNNRNISNSHEFQHCSPRASEGDNRSSSAPFSSDKVVQPNTNFRPRETSTASPSRNLALHRATKHQHSPTWAPHHSSSRMNPQLFVSNEPSTPAVQHRPTERSTSKNHQLLIPNEPSTPVVQHRNAKLYRHTARKTIMSSNLLPTAENQNQQS